jgi:hypothetical protein
MKFCEDALLPLCEGRKLSTYDFLLSFNDITFAPVLMRTNMTDFQVVNRVTHADIGFIGPAT